MKIETERLNVTEFTMDMAQAIHKNSPDADNRRFVPDEVFETVEEAAETIEFTKPFIHCNAMKELETILRIHAARYPQMEPTDAVKLIYQNEFGGGHLIRDEAACLDYLRREYAAVAHDPALPLQESIGNGIVRVHLAALEADHLGELGKAFIASAAAHTGSLDSFLRKLEVLRRLTAQGSFSFDSDTLAAYLREYAQAGYPAVSHSPCYRACYHPAYRIVLAHLLPEE